jgi:small conductance mechanosensitive channel
MRYLIPELWGLYGDSVASLGQKALFALVIALAGKILIRAAGKLLRRATAKFPRFNEAFASITRIAITYAIFIVCIIIILDTFEVNTTSLIAIVGTAGVALGLALKDTLSNVAAGIMLLLLPSYNKGDFIEFGSFMGTVKEKDLFTTILETPDGIFISAPNSSIWGNPVRNHTRNGRRRMELCVRISYADSLETAFGVMRKIAAEETRFLPDPAPQIMVQSLSESAVTVMLRAWARPEVYWDIYWEQMRNVKEKIEAAGLTIPFPQTNVRVVRQEEQELPPET